MTKLYIILDYHHATVMAVFSQHADAFAYVQSLRDNPLMTGNYCVEFQELDAYLHIIRS
jgi:hypothetical protein